jgi:phage gp36-like protein
MAISQIKNYLAGNYDVNLIFQQDTTPLENIEQDIRNAHIVMITIDCALYHLYSSVAPNKIPEHRSNRYQDVIEWLKIIAQGKEMADLPLIINESTGEAKGNFRLSSNNKISNNKW